MPASHDEELKATLTDLTHLAEILANRHRGGHCITTVMWSALSQRTNEARAVLSALARSDREPEAGEKE